MRNSEISSCSVLGIVFVVLKLCNVISWSWWLVLLPFYGILAFILLLAFIAYFISLFLR